MHEYRFPQPLVEYAPRRCEDAGPDSQSTERAPAAWGKLGQEVPTPKHNQDTTKQSHGATYHTQHACHDSTHLRMDQAMTQATRRTVSMATPRAPHRIGSRAHSSYLCTTTAVTDGKRGARQQRGTRTASTVWRTARASSHAQNWGPQAGKPCCQRGGHHKLEVQEDEQKKEP